MIKIATRQKVGKGTLAYHLLGRLERGEASVSGASGAAVSAVILTEEPDG